MNSIEAMLNLRQVAKLLGIVKRSVWRRVADGSLPKPVKIGSAARWFESDIAKYQQRLRDDRESSS